MYPVSENSKIVDSILKKAERDSKERIKKDVPRDLVKAIKDFEALQKRYSRLGANDSEPREVFEEVIDRAWKGRLWTPSNWGLYSRMKGSEQASEKLTKEAVKLAKVVMRNRNNKEAYWYLNNWFGYLT